MFDCGISKIIGDVVTSMEEENEKMIYKAVQSVGIDIDKEQLEKALFNAKNFYDDGYKDAKKQYERKWIPVSERLPEAEYENYLVSTKEGDVDLGTYDREKGWSMCDANGIYFPQYKGIEIVAWMPLPEAYKESEQE